jgi:hypothetical protein
MKFKRGDIVEHILTGQRILILDCHENALMAGTMVTTTIYDARIPERPDLVYHFDEIELREVGSGKT